MRPTAQVTDQAPPPSTSEAGHRVISRDELKQLYLPDNPPNLSLWERYSALLPVVIILALIPLNTWRDRGSTEVAELGVGTCFVDSEASEIDRVDTPDCRDPHDSQVVAVITLDNDSRAYPNESAKFWDNILNQCLVLGSDVVTQKAGLPQDTVMLFWRPTPEGWKAGDRSITCYLHSPSGLVGDFVNGEA